MNRLASQFLRPLSRASFNASPLVRKSLCAPEFIRFFSAQTFLERNAVSERVLSVVKHFDKVDKEKVSEAAKFVDDLGLDSLDVVEVVLAMEEEFTVEIPDAEADKLTTPAEVIDYIAAHPMAK